MVINSCCICGYDLVIDKHHPDGREEVVKWEEFLGEKRPYVIRQPRNPKKVLYLCPNHHAMHHRLGEPIEQMQKEFIKKNDRLKLKKISLELNKHRKIIPIYKVQRIIEGW